VDVFGARFDELDNRTLYAILRLRAEVFVVEQECAFNDVDGRDSEAGAQHVWVERDGNVVAYLRVLEERDGSARIGRVVTAASARGEQLGDAVMEAALAGLAGRTIVLDAQSRLVPWYERLGFSVSGAEFVEDGILHTPMRRAP
jgi:ElaA protein